MSGRMDVDLLRFDPLAEAEKVTGLSYKDDPETMRLGMGLQMMINGAKERAAKAAGDSHFSMDLAETLALYADMGFTEVLCDEFTGTTYSDAPAPHETYRILWHPEGLLATVESYNTTRRNSTKVYYNLAVTDDTDLWSRTSSGSFRDGVWIGNHDGREGIRTNLARLREVGDFLPVWVKSPFLWLVNYAETKVDGYDYRAISAERISRLPARVQCAIGGAR